MRRIIIGISGASGVIIGYRLLQALNTFADIETHLIATAGAMRTFELETELAPADIAAAAQYWHEAGNLAAPVSSGSFRAEGMIVAPCSMKTLAGIANGYTDNLLLRAADVCLKEGRQLLLLPRETPLNIIHLRNLLQAAEAGCRIMPPVLSFYNNPQSLDDQINHIIGKALMQFGLPFAPFRAWEGAE